MIIQYLKEYFDRLPLDRETRKIVNLPNAITAIRIVAVPVLFLLLYDPSRSGSVLIAVIFASALMTDLLDGYVARKYNIITALGKFLDPVADKLLINTAMIILVSIARLDAWIFAVMMIRDLLVEGARASAATEGYAIDVSTLGKQKTFAQAIGLTALIIHYTFFGIDPSLVGSVIVYLAMILNVISGIDYLTKFYRTVLKKP